MSKHNTAVGWSFLWWSLLGTLSYVAVFALLLALLLVDKALMPVSGWAYLGVGLAGWLAGGYLEAKKVWF